MTFKEYQQLAMKTAIYPVDRAIVYPVLGICGEAGEVAEKIKKTIRDAGGIFDEERRQAIALEAGDILWYIAALARDIDISLEEIAEMNIDKLSRRKAKDTIHGEGDDR